MLNYIVILVDGKLAIKWDDETRGQAIDRARAEAKSAAVRVHDLRCVTVCLAT